MTNNTEANTPDTKPAGDAIHSITAAAAAKYAAEMPRRAKVIELVHSKWGFGVPDARAADEEDVRRMKALVADHRASAQAIVNSGLFEPARVVAAAKLRSAIGVYRYMESIRWAAETYVRKADVMPREAMLRANMFPLAYASMDFLLPWNRHEVETGGETVSAHAFVLARGLAEAGHTVTAGEVDANLPDVRAALYALLTAEEGELPLDDDPELAPGDVIDKEVDLLADGDFLDD